MYSLMFAVVCNMLDIAQTVGVVCKYMANPGRDYWVAVKWIFCYLKGTTDTTICYGGQNIDLGGYVDADFVGDHDKRYVFNLVGVQLVGGQIAVCGGFVNYKGGVHVSYTCL